MIDKIIKECVYYTFYERNYSTCLGCNGYDYLCKNYAPHKKGKEKKIDIPFKEWYQEWIKK